jgi:hypothetical protein
MTDASQPLTPFKRELFAQAIFSGNTQEKAYAIAGYKDKRNASRLAHDDDVKRRVNHLLQAKAMRKGITIDSICDELDAAREGAMADKQFATAVSASLGKAKLMGLLIDRKESGKAGEFAHLSIEELRKQLKEDLDALEAIRARKSKADSISAEPLN